MDEEFNNRLKEAAEARKLQNFMTTSNGFKELLTQKRYREDPVLFVERLQFLASNIRFYNDPQLNKKLNINKNTIQQIFNTFVFSQEMLTRKFIFNLSWLDENTNLTLVNESLNDAITIRKMLL